jgi:hypothetical protein
MTVYHRKDNINNGAVLIVWHGMVWGSCDGSDSDKQYIRDFMVQLSREAVKVWGNDRDAYQWNGVIVQIKPLWDHERKEMRERWEILDSAIILPTDRRH